MWAEATYAPAAPPPESPGGAPVPDAPGGASRLVIVEGIMGTGKSTLTRLLAHHLRRSGRPAELHPESWTRPNPTNAGRAAVRVLPERATVWSSFPPDELARRSLHRWRSFVARAADDPRTHVFDGQLFNGDPTLLMLMDEPAETVRKHLEEVVRAAAPLRPVLLHLRPIDLEASLRRTAALRGRKWVRGQVGWKLSSPFARRRRLEGLEGLIELYRDYDALVRDIASGLPLVRIELRVGPAARHEAEAAAHAFLGIRRLSSPFVRLAIRLRARIDEAFAHR